MMTENWGTFQAQGALLLLGAIAGVACGGGTPGGPTQPPTVVESIYGNFDLNGGGGNSLKPFKADGTLTASITFSGTKCATPLEVTMTL